MHKLITWIALVFMLVVGQAHAEVLAVVGGTIVDGNGGEPIKDGVIIIDGNRITAVGGDGTRIPSRARRISAIGKFVIPGLMDAGVYLLGDYHPANMLIRYEGRYDEIAIESAQLALKSGVTAVFDLWGPRVDVMKARNAINAGQVPGARVYVAGNVIGVAGPYSNDFLPDADKVISDSYMARINARFAENVGQELTWMSPDQVREQIRKYIHTGIDFLNVGITEHRLGSGQFLSFSPRVLEAIVDEGHRAGLPVVGFHPMSGESIVYALNAGVDLLFTCDVTSDPWAGGGQPLPVETAALIAQRRTPCGVALRTRKATDWYKEREKGNPAAQMFAALTANDLTVIRSGAQVVLSTGAQVWSADTVNASWFKEDAAPDQGIARMGTGHLDWLRAAPDNGITPMAALMAATRNIARAYKLDKDLGTLEPGKLADLVVLNANPLADPDNYRSISVIIKDGKVVDRDALPTHPTGCCIY